jgi:uncharacterized membrane protein
MKHHLTPLTCYVILACILVALTLAALMNSRTNQAGMFSLALVTLAVGFVIGRAQETTP